MWAFGVIPNQALAHGAQYPVTAMPSTNITAAGPVDQEFHIQNYGFWGFGPLEIVQTARSRDSESNALLRTLKC